MDGSYKTGAVSSLIHLQISPIKKSKEQKKLDKLFGWTSKSSNNHNETITTDLKSSKKKNKNKKEESKLDLQSGKKRDRSSSKEKKLTLPEADENTLEKKQDKIKHVKEKKQDKIKHVKEKKPKNSDDIVSSSRKKTKKFKETLHESSGDSEKNVKKLKKRKVTLESANGQDGHDDDDEPEKKKKKKLKKKNNITDDTEKKGLSSETSPKSIITPVVINDVLCAHKNGLKLRKRPRKDLEEDSDNNDEPIPKRRKKKKRDKTKDFKTVFAGNLPLTITKKQLNKLFSTCGGVESVRLRGAIPANPARGKKYAILKRAYHDKCKSINAYICFVDKESADKACQLMNGKEVDGQHIRVNSSVIDKNVHDHKRSVFVGNLPFAISEEHLRNHFLDCGEISNIRLVRDWKTGIGKGFGYVMFEDTDSADLAVKLDNSKLNNRKIRVFPSEVDPKKRKTDRNHKKDSKSSEKGKVKKNAQKDFVGVKAEKKKKKPKHLARKMGLTTKKKDLPVLKPVEKVTKGPNKHMVFE